MNVLCICPIGIGNYLLLYPACSYLKRTHPDWSLSLLGLRNAIKDLAGEDPLWDEIHIIDPTRMRNPSEGVSMIGKLRTRKYDLSINFFPSNKWQYNLLPFLANVKKRAGFLYPYHPIKKMDFFLSAKVPVDTKLHDVHQNIRLVKRLFGDKDNRENLCFPTLHTDEMRAWAKKQTIGIKRPLVGIHPGSSEEHGMSAKRWEPEKFGTLAYLVCAELDGSALVFGGPGEEPLKEIVVQNSQGRAQSASLTGIGKTAALISECDLFLCNDSGLMHIAACDGVPTVALFGPTDEKRNGPVGESFVIRKEMEGFPIWNAQNVGNRRLPDGVDPRSALAELSPQEAFEKLRPHLKRLISSRKRQFC